jgi:hypothetical protein
MRFDGTQIIKIFKPKFTSMKTIFSLIFLITITVAVSAQTDFENAMIKNLKGFDSANTEQKMKELAAKFERIATAEPTQWLPRYYSALIYTTISFMIGDATDKQSYIDYAQKQLDEASKISPNESEIYTLQGMIYQSTIMIDPMKNGQIYGGKAAGAFQQAVQLDPTNPRPLYLQGVSVMYTPEQYGGGKKNALPMLTKAMELFKNFSPKSNIYPVWGQDQCEQNLNMCKEN